MESSFSSIARTSSITFQTKSGGKRDLRHNDDGERGAGECGRLRGGREMDWGEREPDRVEKVSRGRGCEGPRDLGSYREDPTVLFPVSLFCLTGTASLLVIRKQNITGQHIYTLIYIPGLVYVCLILGFNLRNGEGKALLAIYSTTKGYIDSEQRGHWGKSFPLFLVNGV